MEEANRQIALVNVTKHQLIESLTGHICPACGGPKDRRKTMCKNCYFKLPQGQRVALYDPVGSGYEQAVAAAFARLGKSIFTMPPERQES